MFKDPTATRFHFRGQIPARMFRRGFASQWAPAILPVGHPAPLQMFPGTVWAFGTRAETPMITRSSDTQTTTLVRTSCIGLSVAPASHAACWQLLSHRPGSWQAIFIGQCTMMDGYSGAAEP